MNELILATSNKGKITELNSLLSPIICIAQTAFNISDAAETGLSFVENALIKARHASEQGKKPALADDSGLVVPALNGQPGIYSARYASPNACDEENISLLLENMRHLEPARREAYFYCAIALVKHAQDPVPLIATGVFHGVISTKPAGEHGFGYDPIFFVPHYQCTAAQLSATIKNKISHRAVALTQLKKLMTHSYE